MASKFVLKLLRSGLAKSFLPSLDEFDVIGEPVFTRPSFLNTINEVKVQYSKREEGVSIITISKVSCSYGQGYILQNDGVLWCFEGYYGSLGDGSYDYNELLVPVNPNGGLSFDDITCNYEAPLGLVNGDIYWWGYHSGGSNSTGCSNGDDNETCPWHNTSPALGASGYNFATLSRDSSWNSYVGLAIDTSGKLWGWGYQVFCQIADGGVSDCYHTPLPVLEVTAIDHPNNNWFRVDIGWVICCGVDLDGKLWVWGNDRYGSGGIGEVASSYIHNPRQIGTDTDWFQASAGEYGGVAIKTDGSLWGWGMNTQCQFALPVKDAIYELTKVMDGSFVDVVIDGYCGAALDEDGYLWVWGDDDGIGALGLGEGQGVICTPTRIDSISGIIAFDVGYDRMIASDGVNVWIWGWWDCYYNEYGDYPYSPYNIWSVG